MATRNPALPDATLAKSRSGNMGMYAGFVTRAAALMLDIVIIVVSVLVINALIGLPVTFFLGINLNNCAQILDARVAARVICTTVNVVWIAVALLAGPIYFVTMFATTGQTIGKYVMGVRVVRLDGRAMNFKTSIVRWFGYFVSAVPLGLGFYWVIVDARRQGFHDRLAGTGVIYAWRATGSGRLLERLRTRFGIVPPAAGAHVPPAASAQAPPAPLPTTGRHELLVLAAPDLNQIGIGFRTLEAMVANGEIAVLATDLLLKSADGQVYSIRTGSLPPGSDYRGLTGLPAGVTPDQIDVITSGLPLANYILAVLLDEQAADALVKQVTLRTSVRVSRSAIPANAIPALPLS